MELILASASPRRKEILENLGLDFKIIAPEIKEELKLSKGIEAAVAALAGEKARAVLRLLPAGEYAVLAADTIVVLGGEILGKPRDEKDAFSMLRALSGKSHEVYTGYSVLCGEKEVFGAVKTRVTFAEMTDREILSYIGSKEPLDKAGAYAAQGLGALFIENIEGDFLNVVGLPVRAVAAALFDAAGIGILQEEKTEE